MRSLPSPQSISVVLALLASCASGPAREAQVTPQRPTFSSDTNTTFPGSFELELGAVVDVDDALVVPASLKYGVADRTELFVNAIAYQLFAIPGEDLDGIGDAVVGVRHRAWEDGPTSVAVQFGTKLPAADRDEGLGTGELDFFVAGIVTHVPDARTSVTGYWELGLLGDPDGPGTDSQDVVALAASRSFEGGIGLFGELAKLDLVGDVDPLIATVGLTKTVRPGLVFDVGVGLGANDDAPDTQWIAGLTKSLGIVRR